MSDPFGWSERALAEALGTTGPRLGTALRGEASHPLKQNPALWAEVQSSAAAAAEALSAGVEPPLTNGDWLAYAERGEREPFETPYFARRMRLIGVGLAVVFGDDAYLPALERMVELVCDEPTWALPAHVDDPTTMAHRTTVDLFAAETGQMLAELQTLLADRISPVAAERIRTEVTERVLDPMRPGTSARWWETSPMNWAAVCSGSVLMAALHLETDPVRLAALVRRSLGALDAFLDGFGADGCCAEGLAYWSYGFGYFTAAADLLERATGGVVRIADDDRAVRAAWYGQRTDLGPTRSLSYSDVGPGRPNTAMPVWWARRGVPAISAGRPSVPSDDPCGRWALILRTALWPDPLPTVAPNHVDVFAETGLVVVNRAPYALCVKGGHNDEPHNHLDLGHVSAWLGDMQVIADIGSGVYTAAYFSDARYGFLHPSAGAHNAPRIVREQILYEQRPGSAARSSMAVETDAFLRGRAELDLTAAYPEGLGVGVRRTVTWAFGERGSIVISDAIDEVGTTAVIGFLSPVRPKVEGRELVWELPGGTAELVVPQRAAVAVTVEPTLDHEGAPVIWWRIETRTLVTEGPLQHRLTLLPSDASPSARQP